MSNLDFWDFVRDQTIGLRSTIETPYGVRELTYADHTASGRAVAFIERYLESILEHYGNTHTEDDATGSMTTQRLEQAETTIKRLLNAGDEYKVVMTGSGSTGAVHHLQKILGIYVPPAAHDVIGKHVKGYLGDEGYDGFTRYMNERRPIVFVGPYEHHSNEVSWRECWAEVVEIELSSDGRIDLDDLERKVGSDQYADRVRMGAFSAASNVSGVITPVYDVARILHKHGALAFFDFAAVAPYVDIDVSRDSESYFDAIYFSPHKFLGGPGASGALVFHESIYRADLPPTVSGGGTVNYVWGDGQDYITDVETREKAGTPGILQTMRAALAMELKEELGVRRIGEREDQLIRTALSRLGAHPNIEIIGPAGSKGRMAIVSFNIRVENSYLHPRFVTVLLNDLFGIQSRAGCSCAGPYGHRLLHLDEHQSKALRQRIATGVIGLRPGWVRVNFHFLMTDEEFDYLCRGIIFLADHGRDFLGEYSFDVRSGGWRYRKAESEADQSFGLRAAITTDEVRVQPAATPAELHERYLAEADETAARLRAEDPGGPLKTTERDLVPFVYR